MLNPAPAVRGMIQIEANIPVSPSMVKNRNLTKPNLKKSPFPVKIQIQQSVLQKAFSLV